MPTLRFENSDLPEESRTYAVDIPDGQNVDAVAKSMTDSGWRLVEDEKTDDGAQPTPTNSEAQSAPTNPEGN